MNIDIFLVTLTNVIIFFMLVDILLQEALKGEDTQTFVES